jgi:aspartate/methionine/tyrosine aminotransferase
MELSPFRIERFYAQYEHSTRFMLSSSDCQSRTIAELLELEPDAHERLLECWCGYTESPGAPALRRAIAALYERTGTEEVVVTSCAEEGIFLLYHALLRAGDHETFQWMRPTASPIGFPRVTGIDNLARYCARLAGIGVLLLPGAVYDQPDHIRIGFGRANMPDALELLEANLTDSQ